MSDQENKNPNDQNQEVEKVETVSVESTKDEKDDEYEKVCFIFLIRHTIPSFSLFLLSIFLCHIYKILFRNNRYLKFIRLLIF